MNNIIEVKNLSKNIKGKTIIENMSFNIEKVFLQVLKTGEVSL
ncbi:hypothetical protein NSA27_05535 [Clostridium tepidum]|jgi:ABC-type multidrug transport system ATPase subunit|nr:hypothetical protein [Clostridium tepidum]MCR1934158.1 hypothetical protein [Clostridium tepidum]